MLEPFRTFSWPIDGWLRSITMRITDGQGREVSSRLVHHLNVINLDRRQLMYAMPERVVALGQETGDISLPSSIGMRVKAGSHMGLVLMWHNMTATDYHDLTVTLTFEWMPTNMYPRPLDVWPVYLDVVNPIGRPVDFDLPQGKQQFHAEFTMPISGRVLGVGGHLHDYGTGLVLTDVTDQKPREIVRLGTTLDSAMMIHGVERKFPGIRGAGLKLEKGHRYRLTASYDNTSGHYLKDGAMAHMILLFAPDDPAAWPTVDPDNPDWKIELAELAKDGKTPMSPGMGMRHDHD